MSATVATDPAVIAAINAILLSGLPLSIAGELLDGLVELVELMPTILVTEDDVDCLVEVAFKKDVVSVIEIS